MGKEATFKLKGDVSDLEQKMASVSAKMQDMGKRMQDIGKSMSMYVTAPIVAMGTASVMAFGKQEAAERKLRAALQANGRQVQQTFQRYNEFASEMQRLTTVGDETVLMMLQTAESMDLTGDAAERAVQNSIALEAAFGVNAESAMRMTAALEQGDATMLRRYIPALRDVEDNAKAVAMAQDILSRSFDVAKEDALSFTGSLKQMKNALGDAMEDVGGIIAEALQPLVAWLKQAAEAFQSLDDRTKKIIVVIAGLAAAIGPLLIVLGTIVKTIIPALVAGGYAVSAAWLPLTAVILGVAAAVLIFNSAVSDTRRLIDELSSESTEKLKARLEEIREELNEKGSPALMRYRKELEELQKIQEGRSFADWVGTPEAARMAELIQLIQLEEVSIENSQSKIRELQNEEAAILDILRQREKLNDAEDFDTVLQKLQEQNSLYGSQVGLLGKLNQQISDLNQKKLEALSPEELREVYNEIRNVNKAIDDLYLSMRTIETPDKIEGIGVGILGFEPSVIIESVQNLRDGITPIIQDIKTDFLDLSNFITGTLVEAFDFLGTAIGASISGKDFGGEELLIMIADWGKRLGAIMVAAGLALDGFKKLAITNPIALVGFGAALIAASAAVKAAVSSTPSTGVNQSYGGGGDSGGDIIGLRELGQFQVNVTGEIKAQGSELVTVINNENERAGF